MSDAALPAPGPKAGAPARRSAPRGALVGQVFEGLCFAAATTLLLSLGGIIGSLLIGGWPALKRFGFGFLFSATWNPVTDVYGAAGPIVGTLVTAALALAIALPVAGGVAFFLTELCPAPLRRPIGTAVELLAGIPSIVYGMWGLFVFAPLFAKYIQLPLMAAAKPGSLLETLTTGIPNGSGILPASIILAIMILPFMAATLRELLLTVPPAVRESAYGLGATTAEVVMSVTLPYVRAGAIGAVMLGLGRALGETMAVTFIIGNSHSFPKSLFDSGSTIASTIANEFTEATSPVHTAALIALGLVLFLITFTVLGIARLMLRRQGARL
ncbi:MAG TPA: phosphate ABC transporter permease subunit PstC [Phenylobacterium sp.]|jgi:phosphate transport system permease protein|uniref:phosphate ABC transporter permease subunit PstC n=1 Tax=Phenylobacterium sp. TaxID=1871053 RepID=UPI002CE3AAD8|nr:phosphate ABC transporter permease subunit PstC [Phenylobacterium sp.]HXA39408.1 phosphate ABC transporter permease subunit PstC [Phenylobacterium sp.]